ncbi:MAG: hypothetical protein EOP50_21540 [Sphingobacteriales bacterium]|nr:MAG: hypothetical protein EOP50_21540 [Sphingobacteriales bacterium]
MDGVALTAWSAWDDFWHSAVDPLHKLTWQTGTILLFLVLLVALLATVLLRYSWVFSKPAVRNIVIKRVPHTFQGNLRLSPPDYLKFHKLSSALSTDSPAYENLVKRDSSRYYLITIVETGKRRAILYKEMRLHAPTRRGRAQQNTIQLDQEDLTAIRLNNGYEEDDHPEAEIAGTYNVYIRRVQYFDIRHWLMHPARDIRTVVWVTLITTSLPTLIEVFFG